MNYYQTVYAGNVGWINLTKYFKFTVIIDTETYETEAVEKLFDMIKKPNDILDHFGIEQVEGEDLE